MELTEVVGLSQVCDTVGLTRLFISVAEVRSDLTLDLGNEIFNMDSVASDELLEEQVLVDITNSKL
jgi:hypothetical protein